MLGIKPRLAICKAGPFIPPVSLQSLVSFLHISLQILPRKIYTNIHIDNILAYLKIILRYPSPILFKFPPQLIIIKIEKSKEKIIQCHNMITESRILKAYTVVIAYFTKNMLSGKFS